MEDEIKHKKYNTKPKRLSIKSIIQNQNQSLKQKEKRLKKLKNQELKDLQQGRNKF